MTNVIFRCPQTALKVQHWLADEPLQPDEKRCTYEGVTCPACTRVHFIDRSTGKLLGQKE
ncbi:hypothetical protein NL528_24805 [Bradyrhizobium sp. Ash2021]|nr:hypothetical protein NL528_24805 [Bradyrhizobium sp. Ash2021]